MPQNRRGNEKGAKKTGSNNFSQRQTMKVEKDSELTPVSGPNFEPEQTSKPSSSSAPEQTHQSGLYTIKVEKPSEPTSTSEQNPEPESLSTPGQTSEPVPCTMKVEKSSAVSTSVSGPNPEPSTSSTSKQTYKRRSSSTAQPICEPSTSSTSKQTCKRRSSSPAQPICEPSTSFAAESASAQAVPPVAPEPERNSRPGSKQNLFERLQFVETYARGSFREFLDELRGDLIEGFKLLGEIGVSNQVYRETRDEISIIKEELVTMKNDIQELRIRAEAALAEEQNLFTSSSEHEVENSVRRNNERARSAVRSMSEEHKRFQQKINSIARILSERETQIETMRSEYQLELSRDEAFPMNMPNSIVGEIMERMREDFQGAVQMFFDAFGEHETFEEENEAIWRDIHDLENEMKGIRLIISRYKPDESEVEEEERLRQERESQESRIFDIINRRRGHDTLFTVEQAAQLCCARKRFIREEEAMEMNAKDKTQRQEQYKSYK